MKRPSLRLFSRPRLLRASDADRDAYAEIVNKAYSEGQLDAVGLEERTSRVLNAKTVGQLDDAVADLVIPEPAPSAPSTRPRPPQPQQPTTALSASARRTRAAILGGAAVVTAGAIGLIIFASTGVGTDSDYKMPDDTFASISASPSPSTSDSAVPAVDMYTADGLETVVDAIVEAAGGRSEFTSVALYGEYAIATGPGPEGGIRLERYDWRAGEVTTSPGSAVPDELLLFDIDDVDLAAIARLAKEAPKLTGVLEPTSFYVFFDRRTSTVDEVVEIRVNLSNEFQNGYVTAESTGEVITIVGPAVPPDTTRFFRAEPLAGALAAVRARVGHDEVTSVLLYPERVSAEAPPEAGDDVVDSYQYRGGTLATLETYTPIQPDDVRRAVFSIATIDAEVVAGALAKAVVDSGVEDGTLSYASVERPIDPPDHDPVLVVFVGNKYTSERVIYSLAGELLQVG